MKPGEPRLADEEEEGEEEEGAPHRAARRGEQGSEAEDEGDAVGPAFEKAERAGDEARIFGAMRHGERQRRTEQDEPSGHAIAAFLTHGRRL